MYKEKVVYIKGGTVNASFDMTISLFFVNIFMNLFS